MYARKRMVEACMRKLTGFGIALIAIIVLVRILEAGSEPTRAKKGMVISSSAIGSETGAQVLRDGGNAIDAAVATAFALAVTHPGAGNIGGRGFLLYRLGDGDGVTDHFLQEAPGGASPNMV